MSTTGDRLTRLQAMLQKMPEDAFLLYGIALEHKRIGNLGEAVRYLQRVLEREPDNCAAHQQMGQVHELSGNFASSRQAYRAGIEAAGRTGNHHARDEMASALSLLPEP